jgi:hypothetical protein
MQDEFEEGVVARLELVCMCAVYSAFAIGGVSFLVELGGLAGDLDEGRRGLSG